MIENVGNPIFIHSVFRSGSTYLFNVFRRSKFPYYCFQEPLHETVFCSRENPALLKVENLSELNINLRHPSLAQDYFKETADLWPSWRDSVYEDLIYDEYFLNIATKKNTQFWKELVAHAPAKAVFQECRTAGRIKLLREELGGVHIYLWRNPWDQWWSYKVNRYFDAANQLVIHSAYAPTAVKRMVDRLGLVKCNTKNIGQLFDYYYNNPLSAEQSYQAFYMTWVLGLRNGLDHCHLNLSIDRLSDDLAYRDHSLGALASLGIGGVNLNECQIPQSIFTQDEQDFFRHNEALVHHDLLSCHWDQQGLDHLLQYRDSFEPLIWSGPDEIPSKELKRQLGLARSTAVKIETSYSTIIKEKNAMAQQAQEQAMQAEAKAQQAQEQAMQAEAKAQQAQEQAMQAEAKAQQAQEQAMQAEAKAQQAQEASQLHVSQLHAIYNSTSWRITVPLRWPVHQLRLLRTHGFKQRIKAVAKKVLRKIVPWLVAKPKLKSFAIKLAYKFGMAERLKPFVRSLSLQPVNSMQSNADNLNRQFIFVSYKEKKGVNADQRTPLEMYESEIERVD